MADVQTFDFELVSPERKLLSEPMAMAVIPGEEGDIGVLPNHSALLTSVRPGVMKIFTAGNDTPQEIFIAGGFADISAENCTVLAEEAIALGDLDQATLEQEITNLNEDLGMVEGDADKARVDRALYLTKAKLAAVTGQLVA